MNDAITFMWQMVQLIGLTTIIFGMLCVFVLFATGFLKGLVKK